MGCAAGWEDPRTEVSPSVSGVSGFSGLVDRGVVYGILQMAHVMLKPPVGGTPECLRRQFRVFLGALGRTYGGVALAASGDAPRRPQPTQKHMAPAGGDAALDALTHPARDAVVNDKSAS